LTRDIKYGSQNFKLLRRNVQKRLFIGIACELLLKSLFLRKGYCINKPQEKANIKGKFPYKLKNIDRNNFQNDDTITFGKLMEKMYEVHDFGGHKKVIDTGFRIAKVFRNKESHTTVLWHDYEPQDYRDIEKALVAFYQTVFNEKLSLKFSVRKNENAEFHITNTG
jgi:hypothetical protein